MDAKEWTAAIDPQVMLEALADTASERKLRLFACACARRVYQLVKREYVEKEGYAYVYVGEGNYSRIPMRVGMTMVDHHEGPRAERAEAFRQALLCAELYEDGVENEFNPWGASMDLYNGCECASPESFDQYWPSYYSLDQDLRSALEAAVEYALLAPMTIYDRGEPGAATAAAANAAGIAAIWALADEWDYRTHPEDYVPGTSYYDLEVEGLERATALWREARTKERSIQSDLCREVFGNPYPPVTLDLTAVTAVQCELGNLAYREACPTSGMLDPIRIAALADELLKSDGMPPEIVAHFQNQQGHVRGCWALDLLLGKK